MSPLFSPPDAFLSGAIVQRVDRLSTPLGEAALVRVRVPASLAALATPDGEAEGETLHLLLVANAQGGLGVVPRGGDIRTALRDRGGAEPLWRARLEGGRVARVEERAIAVLRNGVDAYVLEADTRGRVTLLEREGAEAAPGAPLADTERARLEERGAALAAQLASTALTEARGALARAIAKGLARIDRRIEAVRGDLARIAEADALAARAQLFVAEASRAPRGARSLKVVDWSTGEAVTVELPLDPARPAREQLDAMFKRARRLKEGARIGRQRLADAEEARAKVAAVAAAVAQAETQAELEELGRRAKSLAPRDISLVGPSKGAAHRATPGQAPKPAYRTFLASDGERILVGRGAAHNDVVTFRVGRPHDLWLHAKGYTGAHVIVPLPKSGSCPAERLVEAAHLAAHFSDAKDEGVVEVQYTPRRYLRKPRGSVPGFVVVDREKVMMLRRDEAVLRRLLEREEVA